MAVATAPGQAAVPAVPFRKATVHKRTYLASKGLAAALGGQVDWQLDAKGYLGGIRLLVTGTETTVNADPTAAGDWPWNLFATINLRDSNGGMLKNLKGYSAFIANRYFQPLLERDLSAIGDTRAYTVSISAVQANTIRFSLDLPVEAGTRDNLGLVPNQNAAFNYFLSLGIAQESDVVSTVANASWDLTVQPAYDYYTVPANLRADGSAQASAPPFAGIIRQVWDEPVNVNASSENRINLTPGRVVRNLAFIARTSAGARVSGGITRIKLYYGDDTLLKEWTEMDLLTEHYYRFGDVLPTGVYVITQVADNDGLVGADFRRDVLDSRRLAQMYALVTTAATVVRIDVVHDELIVPQQMSI